MGCVLEEDVAVMKVADSELVTGSTPSCTVLVCEVWKAGSKEESDE